MKQFFRLWLYGYIRPYRMVEGLNKADSPFIGFFSTLVRGLINALLLYLPLYVMGRVPSLGSSISFIETKDYFLFLFLIVPFYFLFLWLFLSGAVYVILRIIVKRRPNFDHLLNIFGLIGLVVGSFLLLWDWLWILLGSTNYVLLGISHLVIDIWAIVLTVISLKRILGVPIWIGVILNLIWILLALPLTMLIMRSPL